jgi:hypothetical protein
VKSFHEVPFGGEPATLALVSLVLVRLVGLDDFVPLELVSEVVACPEGFTRLGSWVGRPRDLTGLAAATVAPPP